MKKVIALLIVAAVGVTLAGPVPNGKGATGTATTTPTVVLVPGTNYCYAVSVDNSGTVPIRFHKILETPATTNGFVVGEALVVPGGGSYTAAGGTIMNEKTRRQIYGVVVATESSSAAYTVNFE